MESPSSPDQRPSEKHTPSTRRKLIALSGSVRCCRCSQKPLPAHLAEARSKAEVGPTRECPFLNRGAQKLPVGFRPMLLKKSALLAAEVLIQFSPMGRRADDGRTDGGAGRAVLWLQPRAACAGRPPPELDRPVCRPIGSARAVAPFYSAIGRPSIDPELIIRMLMVGYCFGIRSERRLCEEVHLNLAYRWFCRLGLEGAVPDHSTFSKTRHGRFRDGDLLRQLFETTVKRCIAEGLVGGDGFAVDASLIRAEANRQRFHPGEQILPPTGQPGGRRVSRGSRRRGLWRRHTGRALARVAVDPAARYTSANGGQRSSAMPPTTSSTSARRHRRCGGEHGGTPGRGNGRETDDRACSRRFGLWPASSSPTPAMARRRCSTGWSTSAASTRTSLCSTSPRAGRHLRARRLRL